MFLLFKGKRGEKGCEGFEYIHTFTIFAGTRKAGATISPNRLLKALTFSDWRPLASNRISVCVSSPVQSTEAYITPRF